MEPARCAVGPVADLGADLGGPPGRELLGPIAVGADGKGPRRRSSSRPGSRNAQNSLPSTSASVTRCGWGHSPRKLGAHPLAGEYSARTVAPKSRSGSTPRTRTSRWTRFFTVLARLCGRNDKSARCAGRPRAAAQNLSTARGSTASTKRGPSATVTPTPCRGCWVARTPNGPPPRPGAGSSALRAPEPSPGWRSR